jgi:hypothetical protein
VGQRFSSPGQFSYLFHATATALASKGTAAAFSSRLTWTADHLPPRGRGNAALLQPRCNGPWGEIRVPAYLTSHQRQEAIQRLAAGETQADIARSYAVDATTIG